MPGYGCWMSASTNDPCGVSSAGIELGLRDSLIAEGIVVRAKGARQLPGERVEMKPGLSVADLVAQQRR